MSRQKATSLTFETPFSAAKTRNRRRIEQKHIISYYFIIIIPNYTLLRISFAVLTLFANFCTFLFNFIAVAVTKIILMAL